MENIPIRHIKATAKEPGVPESFSIRDVRELLGGKDMVQALHRHDFFYMLALKKGAGSHAIDFISYKVGDQYVFFMRPGQVHQLTLKAGSAGYLLAFNAGFYPSGNESNQLLRRAGHTNLYQPGAGGFKKLHAVLTYIFREYTGKQAGYQKIITANLDIFFVELLRQHTPHVPNTGSTYTQERLEEFLALVETHIATHKQVSDYADMLHLSPYQLNAITKAALGKTCSALIDAHIVLESKRYLLATSSQVSQVAGQLGYEDVSYFIRFFKKHTGYSPEAFRHHFS